MPDITTNGFLIDSPIALLRTSTGVKSIINSMSGEVSFSGDSIQIESGWSNYITASIDTKKGIEVKLTDAEWSLDSEALNTGGTITVGATSFDFYGKKYVIDETGTVTIPRVAVTGSVSVPGYTETVEAIPAAGNFKVTIGTDTKLLFPVADAGKSVEPAYTATITNGVTMSVKKTDKPKIAEVILTFPLFDNADSDSADIVSYFQIIIFKGKISPTGTTGGGRKSAATKDLTISGLDPRRADEKIFDYRVISTADYLG